MARTLRAELVAGDPCPSAIRRWRRSRRRDGPRRSPGPSVPSSAPVAARGRHAPRTRRPPLTSRPPRSGSRRLAPGWRNARTRLELADEALRDADAALAAAQSELVDRLGEGDPRALLEERSRELSEASAAAERAAAEATEARSALERARRDSEESRARLAAVANRLASIWGMLGEPREVAAEPAAVHTAFVDAGERIVRGPRGGARRRSPPFATSRQRRRPRCARCSSARAWGRTTTSRWRSRRRPRSEAPPTSRCGASLATIEAGADLDARHRSRPRTSTPSRSRLVADLQPSRFLAFLLEEERRGTRRARQRALRGALGQRLPVHR